MKFIKLLICVNIFLFCYQSSSAQVADTVENKTIDIKAQYITNKIADEITLTSLQEQKIFEINKERLMAIAILRSSSNFSISKLEKINNAAIAKFIISLTAEQKTLLLTLTADLKAAKERYLKENPGYTFSEEDLELSF